VFLASAGTAEPLSRRAVEAVAKRWSGRLGRPVTSAFATGAGPRVDVAVARLRAQGAERVAVSGLFLAPGRLPEAVRRTAIEAGAAVAEPLGADPRLVRLVARRSTLAAAHSLLTH
jgi:sirohydrochlorin ferrochelatase